MDEEYGKALYEMIDAVVVWRINLYDTIKEVIGSSVPIYVHPFGVDFEFSIDGSFEVTADEIKEIERRTGAEYTGKCVDYDFKFEGEVL